jgi:hypothetical protein
MQGVRPWLSVLQAFTAALCDRPLSRARKSVFCETCTGMTTLLAEASW